MMIQIIKARPAGVEDEEFAEDFVFGQPPFSWIKTDEWAAARYARHLCDKRSVMEDRRVELLIDGVWRRYFVECHEMKEYEFSASEITECSNPDVEVTSGCP
jgi:hypothetical protein